MDWQSLFFSTYELVSSLFFALVTIFIVTKFLNLTFLKSGSTNILLKANTAVGIFAGTMFVSTLILVQSSVLPSVDAMRTMVLGQDEITIEIVLISLAYLVAFYAISLVISIAVIYLSTQAYLIATIRIDEMAEIRKNNIAVALLVSAVVLGTTIFFRPAMQRFISSLVNYETLESLGSRRAELENRRDDDYIVPRTRNMPERR